MKVHEYQAKLLLQKFGVAIPRGEVTDNPSEAREIAKQFGGRCVVKAQIHAGGRGKGGGVKLAKNPDEAYETAKSILGMTLVTHQTGPEGRVVRKVLVEEALDIARELYLGVTARPRRRQARRDDLAVGRDGDRRGRRERPVRDPPRDARAGSRDASVPGAASRVRARARRHGLPEGARFPARALSSVHRKPTRRSRRSTRSS